jgi:hypothetical protein
MQQDACVPAQQQKQLMNWQMSLVLPSMLQSGAVNSSLLTSLLQCACQGAASSEPQTAMNLLTRLGAALDSAPQEVRTRHLDLVLVGLQSVCEALQAEVMPPPAAERIVQLALELLMNLQESVSVSCSERVSTCARHIIFKQATLQMADSQWQGTGCCNGNCILIFSNPPFWSEHPTPDDEQHALYLRLVDQAYIKSAVCH